MEKRTSDLLYVILIVAVLIFIVWIVIWIKGESQDCLQQPFVYGVNHLNEKNMQCSCRNERGGIYEFNGTDFIGKAQVINISEQIFKFG
jgi:hypothetical protein